MRFCLSFFIFLATLFFSAHIFSPVLAVEEISLNTQTPNQESVSIIVKKKKDFLLPSFSGLLTAETQLFAHPLGPEFRSLEKVFLVKVKKSRADELLDKLKNLPDVEYAEVDGYYLPQVIPNDPFYPQQWYYHKFLNMENIWELNFSQAKNIAAVIDTGIDNRQEDLKQVLWKNPREIPNNLIDDDGNGYIDDVSGWNVTENNNHLTDDCGHGTLVTSVLAAGFNNAKGIAGMLNTSRKIIAVKANVSNLCVTNYSDLAKALVYAASLPEVKVINLSLGGNADSQLVREAVQSIVAINKIVVVAGAGNNGSDLKDNPFYPSSYKGVVSVGAYDKTGKYYKYNYGYKLDVLAPGKNVWIAFSGGGYGKVSGTSLATPFVSGQVLLVSEKFANFSASEIIQVLRNWADCPLDLATCGRDGWDKYYGYGRINAETSLLNKCTGGRRIKSTALISFPKDRETLTKNPFLEIKGTALSNNFTNYILQWSNNDDFNNWSKEGIVLTNNGLNPVSNGLLGAIDTNKLPGLGWYLLRLVVKGEAPCLKNKVAEDRSIFFLP